MVATEIARVRKSLDGVRENSSVAMPSPLLNIAFLLCFRDVLNIIVFYCVFTRANTKIYAPRKENTGRRKGNQRLHKVSAKSGNVNISLDVW